MTLFSPRNPIRVLIVDDSALMRQMLSSILTSDPEITVVDTASDPLIAREKIKQHNPDVITLDIEMPRMNGIDFLQKIMTLRPTPVIMISSLTQEGADVTLRALDIGAVDFVGKPAGFIGEGMADLRDDIIAKVKAAAQSHVRASQRASQGASQAPRQPHRLVQAAGGADKVIAIGASTGGVPAIASILEVMPKDAPPILIVQHMPPSFTSRFAARLNDACAISVSEARDGELIKAGHAYIAPGGLMMRMGLDRNPGGRRRVLSVREDVRINGFCPSVDALFSSVATTVGDRCVGVLLTGMGHDGARGLLQMRQAGAVTIGQDESSCVVYGMPRVASLLGAVQRQIALPDIPSAVLDACAQPTPAIG